MLNEDLAFYQEQNEKNVQECESLRQNIESLEVSSEYVVVFCSSVVLFWVVLLLLLFFGGGTRRELCS